jgi:hypothetical protein
MLFEIPTDMSLDFPLSDRLSLPLARLNTTPRSRLCRPSLVDFRNGQTQGRSKSVLTMMIRSTTLSVVSLNSLYANVSFTLAYYDVFKNGKKVRGRRTRARVAQLIFATIKLVASTRIDIHK